MDQIPGLNTLRDGGVEQVTAAPYTEGLAYLQRGDIPKKVVTRDGWYRVRVTASDAAANSPDRALTSSQTTTMFAIDNTRPAIENLSVNYPKAGARATDAISTIAEMSYSGDDGPWQLGAASDGLYDDQTEELRIDLPTALPRGTHTLAVRVADAAGNVGAQSTTFVIR